MSAEAVTILVLVAFNLGLMVGMILGRSHFIR
jgi:hypothetical protein